MPYKTKKVGNKTCVYKKEGNKKIGCTKGSAKKYLAALHANAESKETIFDKMYDEILMEERSKSIQKKLCKFCGKPLGNEPISSELGGCHTRCLDKYNIKYKQMPLIRQQKRGY